MRGHLQKFLGHINWWLALVLCGSILGTGGKGMNPACPPKGYDITEISPCKCRLSTEDYLQVWCSGADLEALTRGLASVATWRGSAPVDELVVEGGVVSGLPGRAFAPLRIRRLLMHRSGLERVSSAAFLESSLVELMLVEPRLRSLPADLLDTLPLLEALTIDVGDGDSGVSADGDAFPGRPVSVPLLRSLPSLRYLRISAPQTSGLSGIFPPRDPAAASLPALLSLSVYGGWAHTRTTEDGDDGLWSLLSFTAGCCGGLEELTIAGNGLRLGKRLASKSASPRGDVSLRSLRVLDMSDNPLGLVSESDLALGDGSMGVPPPQTQWLLDGAPAWIFPSLSELRVDRASISVLPEGAVRSVGRLERLSLEGNSMRSIGPDALTDLPALHELRLRDNLLSEESMPPPPHRRRLPWTLPTLKGLDLSKNILRGGTALRRLLSGVPSVRRLDISDNAIGSLADDAFAATPLLEFVDLSGNPVLTPPSRVHLPFRPSHLSFLKPLSRLYELRISGNSPETASGSLPVEPRRRYLDRGGDNNSFPALPPLPGVEVLVAADMDIRRLYRSASSSPPPFSAALLPRLTVLDLSGNSLATLEPGAFSGVSPTLTGMDLSRNRLSGVLRLGPPLPMKSLKRLDVSDNRLEAISVVSSAASPELKVLNASGNGISSLEMGLPSVLGQTLEVVDFSRNAMVVLTEGPLKPFMMLTELWLDANDICSISGRPFDATPRLRVLSLRDNRLATLSPVPFRRLLTSPTAYSSPAAADSTTSARSHTLLRLEGNPLSCSCHLLWLQEWLQEAEEEDGEEEMQGLKCKDGTPLRHMRLTRKDCQHQLTTSALISSGGDASVVDELDIRNGGASCQEEEEFKDQASPPQELSARPIAISSAQQQQHPSPEESEYFYDQYVDEIHPPAPLGNSDNNVLEDTHTESAELSTLVTTTEAVINTTGGETSNDYISGDTPTIYAATRPKNESFSGNKDGGSDNGGGISIFGIPIPSWNLSGLFGSGKKRAGGSAKVARINNATGSPVTGQGRRRGNPKVMADRSPIHSPKLESGFRPIFLGSGGFVPITGKVGPSSGANSYRDKVQPTFPLSVKPLAAPQPTPPMLPSSNTLGGSVVHVAESEDAPSVTANIDHAEHKSKQPFISNTVKAINMTTIVETPVNCTHHKHSRHGMVRDKYVTTTEATDFVSSFASVTENGRRFQSKWGGSRVIGTVERVELKKNVGVEVGSLDRSVKNSVGKAIMVSGESETNGSIKIDSGKTTLDGGAFVKNIPEIITVKGEMNDEIGRTNVHDPSPSYLSTTEVISSSLPSNSKASPAVILSTSTQTIQSSATLPMSETNIVFSDDITMSTTWTSTVRPREITSNADHITLTKNASTSQIPTKENTPKPSSQLGPQGTPLSSYLLAPGGQARVTKVSKTSTSQRRHQYSSQFDGEYFPQAIIHASADIEFDDIQLHKQDRTKSGIGYTKWPSNDQTKRSRLPEWYYANYNATEKDVYKGPIEDIIVTEGYPGFPSSSTSCLMSHSNIFNLTLLIFIYFSGFFNPD